MLQGDDGLPTLAEVDAALANTPTRTSSAAQGLALLAISLMLFLGAQRTLFGDAPWTFFGLLVAVLVLHELGHLAAMRLFGFRDLRMFFIPFFGAAAAGKKPDATGTQRAIVALAGPLPGIVLGLAWIVAVALTDAELGPLTAEFIGLMLVLNFFNLLPIVPFDGGRFVSILLFSRWPGVEQVFRMAASAALVWFAVQIESWVLGIVGAFVALTAGTNARYARLGRHLRSLVPAPRPLSVLDIPPAIRSAAIFELAPILGVYTPSDRRAGIYARTLSGVWERALDAPPGLLASVVLLAIYGVFVAIGVVLYATLPGAAVQ